LESLLVIGSSNTDMVTYLANFPTPGETVEGIQFATFFGGKGANQAITANRFSIDSYFISCLGNDYFGENMLDHFKKEQLNIDFIQRVNGESGVATILVDEKGQNQIIVVPGSNYLIDSEKIISAINKIPKLFTIVAQLEIPEKVIIESFKEAQKLGIITILNPAPGQKISEELLSHTDWLIPNETEFSLIHPENKYPDDTAIKFLAHQLNTNLVVTLGGNGIKICLKDGTFYKIQAQKVKVVDTTAAGDVFVGSFAALLTEKYDPLIAAELASRIATQSVTRHGAQNSIPSKEEILEIISSGI